MITKFRFHLFKCPLCGFESDVDYGIQTHIINKAKHDKAHKKLKDSRTWYPARFTNQDIKEKDLVVDKL